MPKYKYDPEEGFAHLFLLIAVVALVGLIGSSNIPTTKEFSKTLASQNVLGEDEESKKAEEKTKEAAKQIQEQQKEVQQGQEENQKKQEEQNRETLKTQEEQKKENSKSSQPGSSNLTETEIETADGQKIKTKVEDNGTTKVEIEYGQLKLKYVVENGQIKLKAENEEGREVELEEEELEGLENEIENGLEEDGIEIATGSGKPILTKNNVAALTDFPLSIDVGTNQLILTTPSGQKSVTVLPDQAVQNLLATNIINRVEQVSDANLASDLKNLDGVVKLEIRNNEVVYKVKGTKRHKLLGFIPVDSATTVFVSADTGQPVAQEQTVLTNIIDFLSS